MTLADINNSLVHNNQFSDYWRYCVGVDVIPADTRNKKPLVPWLEWQDEPIPEWPYVRNIMLQMIKEHGHEKSGGYS